MTSYRFAWTFAALGMIALALLLLGYRGVLVELVLGGIAGVGCVMPLAWYIRHGYFEKRKG